LRLFLSPTGCVLMRAHAEQAAAPQVLHLPGIAGADDLAPLAAALNHVEWRFARVEILLSHRYVRFVLSEPPGRLLNAVEERALVEAELRRVYGAAAQGFRVRVTSQPPDAGVFGAAMDDTLVAGLEALMAASGVKHYSLRPWLERAGQRRAISHGWWVLAEPGWVCLLLAQNGVWRQVSAQPCGTDWVAVLPAWLERAARLLDEAPPRVVRVQAVDGVVPQPLALPTGWHSEIITDALIPASIEQAA
jgi:hypothetical protein